MNRKENNGRKSVHSGTDNALEDFFFNTLKDIYWAEKHLPKALTKMAKEATTEDLKEAFTDHRSETEEHVNRLEWIFEQLDRKAVAKKCEAMEGLIEEGEEVISETEKGTATRDVGLIIAAQKVEHYEIAAYGGLRTLANTLGWDDIAAKLEKTLEEEKKADQLLTQIAEENVNYKAVEEPMEV
jgi:ferritin-like metal-binding protein YciE